MKPETKKVLENAIDAANGKPVAIEPTPEQIAEFEARFNDLVEKKQIHVDVTDGIPNYLIARSTFDRAEAVQIADRLRMAEHFDRIKSICFVNGIIDGVTQYRNSIRKLGGVSMDKAVDQGNRILSYVEAQKSKL